MMTKKILTQLAHRPVLSLIITVVIAFLVMDRGFHAQSPNPIPTENGLPGTAASQWDIGGIGDPSIQGFATDISVNRGQTVAFKIKTDSSNYKIDIYRLGYYGGAGARLVAQNLVPSAPLPQTQPACLQDAATGLTDCGNWTTSASWLTAGAVSGIYLAKLNRFDSTGGSSHIVFVVRDDARQADVVVQTSDTTWQAYNQYGAGSLYCGGPVSNAGSAYASSCQTRSSKVSYNRPFTTREQNPQSFLFNAEYPMVRWLEANGYNVKYTTGVDTDRRAGDLVGGTTKPKVFLSSGHDEYWSAGQRASVEAARAAGVSLAFFSGNEMYWKTRYEPSIDGTNTAYRTLVSYKDTLAGVKLDPTPNVATGTWRDLRFAPPVADGGRAENAVTGTIWTVNQTPIAGIEVPAALASHRFWRNAALAFDGNGIATLTPESLGYEWDEDLDNGVRPAGITHLSSTTIVGVEKIIDFGATTGQGTATHSLTLYRHSSGSLVFGAGTVQWSWGLDSNHDRGSYPANRSMQQATMNLLADMGAQPASVQPGLIATAGSSDTVAPASTITAPATGATVSSGTHLTISGTASDIGGVVAGVEVSVDGGATWRAATGRAAWTYDWVPGPQGATTIKSRAVDDSANIEPAGSGTTVTVNPGSTSNLMIWPSSPTPSTVDVIAEVSPVELGLKFRSDSNSVVSGVRFYKSMANVGTHVGNLWTISGTLIASTTFANESTSGWQTANFATPVTLTAGTTYVVSYHTNLGHYSADGGYFATTGVDSAPFHAPAAAAAGGNGVYIYGGSSFPTQTFNATNYWVDIVGGGSTDSTPPVISDFQVAIGDVQAGAASAVVSWNTTEPSTSRIDYSTVSTFPSAQTVTVSDAAYVTAHRATLAGLVPNTQYYFRIFSTDPAGNTGTLAICPPGVTCGSAGGSTPPLGYLMPGPTMRDTTAADFSAGTSTGTYVSEMGDPQRLSPAGELVLAPSLGDEFSGSSLSSNWSTSVWTSGIANVGGGRLTVSGALVASCVLSGGTCSNNLTAGHSLEFVATFTGDLYQHAGFGQTFNAPSGTVEPFAIFSTVDANGANTDGSLFARTNDGANETVTSLGQGLLGAPHRFRIDWNAGNVSYWVDGIPALAAPAYTTNVVHPAVVGPMRVIAASEYRGLSGTVSVDWTRLTPYSASGTFTSRVFDAGVKTSWQSLTSVVNPSAGTVVIRVRTSNDGSTWTGFAPFAAGLQSRYIQYQATLTTSDPNLTPQIDDVMITGAAAPPVVLATPTVTFTGAPTTAAYASTFTVASSTNASTPAVITATGACAITGNLVKMTSGTGVCSLSASWAADSIFLAATATQSTTATKINPTTTAVVASASTSNYGQAVTLTGTISSPVGTPTGTVTYKDVVILNGVIAPQATIGSASLSGSNALYSTFMLGAGTHSVTVSYGGDSNYNGSNSSLIIVTVIPVGIVSVNPTSVSFPSQPVGVTSMAIPVTITNIGDANLTINSILISGDNGSDFAMSSNTCVSTLTVGASCVVNVKFKPLATGTRTASLILTDNDNGIAGSKQPISLVGSSMTTSKANFTAKPIAAGRTLWFASELTLAKGPRDGNNIFKDMTSHPVRVLVTNGVITFTANGVNYSIPVPDAMITFSPLVTQATTTFDAASNRWLTTVPTVDPTSKRRQFDLDGRIFASGVPMPVPVGGLPGGIQNVTWSAAYTTDTPGMQLQWRWGAAVYSSFSADYNALKVKPVDAVRAPWALMINDDQAGTPEAFKQFFLQNGGGTADDANDFTGDLTPNVGVVPDVAQANIAPIPVVFPGNQGAGTTSAPITVAIANNHQTISLIVSSLSLTGPDFTVVGGTCSMTSPTTLVGGASCTVSLTFSPKDLGTRAGSLNIGFSTPPGIAADEAPLPYKLDLVGTGK